MVSNRRAGTSALLALSTAGVLAGTTLNIHAADAAPTQVGRQLPITAEAPVFDVVSQGFSEEEAKALADRAGVRNALRKDGGFSFVGAAFARVPSIVGSTSLDEKGRKVVVQKIDMEKLRAVRPLSGDKALSLARELLPVPEGFEVSPRVGHTQVQLSDRRGGLKSSFSLDTTVSYDLSLNQAPVFGPGAKSRITFNGKGRVVSLLSTMRSVKQAGFVGIIGPEDAKAECTRLYGGKVEQATPTLVYFAPPLGASVQRIVPSYACHPANIRRDAVSALGGRLVPAAPNLTPQLLMAATRDGSTVKAEARVEGGTAPYQVKWGSATTRFAKSGDAISYTIGGRKRGIAERLTATVIDANGVVSTASVRLPASGGSAEAQGYGGGGGAFGSVGVEDMVDEWQCAMDSAQGFHNVMAAHSQTVKFDWRGLNTWESDFHKTSTGGHDDGWVDSVDAQWYTGHGSPGGFTFRSNHPDNDITPSDARWGDNFNLEWMQLESCQVLKDTDGHADYFGRWAPAFGGLHLLNGFDTNATCIDGGTGWLFGELLFPSFWHSAMTVSQAWGAMANILEPGGTKWRSVSPIGPGGSFNLNDHYWGQGSTGADIPPSARIGFISISSTV